MFRGARSSLPGSVTPLPLGPPGSPSGLRVPAAIHPSPPGNAGSGCQGYCRLAPLRPSPRERPSGRPISLSAAARNTKARRDRTFKRLRGASPAAGRALHPGRGKAVLVPRGPALAVRIRGALPCGEREAQGGAETHPPAGGAAGTRWPGGDPARSPSSPPGCGPKAEGCLCWAVSPSGSVY